MSIEKEIDSLTKSFARQCEGKNSAIAVGAAMNIINSCMVYGDSNFQRVTAESLRGMANVMLQSIGKKTH